MAPDPVLHDDDDDDDGGHVTGSAAAAAAAAPLAGPSPANEQTKEKKRMNE